MMRSRSREEEDEEEEEEEQQQGGGGLRGGRRYIDTTYHWSVMNCQGTSKVLRFLA